MRLVMFRLADLTHQEVEEMQKQVDVIVEKTIKPNVADSGKSEEFADFKASQRAMCMKSEKAICPEEGNSALRF